MSLRDTLNPNKHQYKAGQDSKYLTTRLLTHNGITIAFALGKSAKKEELFFDYSILNAPDSEDKAALDGKAAQEGLSSSAAQAAIAEKLDSQCWFENVKTLRFSSELRVVGEEAVPVYQIPLLDRTRRPVSLKTGKPEKIDPWLSTSLGLMDPSVTNFEVLSDGRYIYLFRQSRKASDPFPDDLSKPDTGTKALKAPINANILCDRFNLVGSSLNRSLEVRYRRSRQKRLPLNDRDTLAVHDIDDVPFYEPTFSLRFVSDIVDGRFSVLRTPTMTNELTRWMFFAVSGSSRQIDCYTTDVGSDGLFDLHGQIYYQCNSENHSEEIFSTSPGVCTALSNEGPCGETKKAIVPKAAISDKAILLYKGSLGTRLVLSKPIPLTGPQFSEGFTLEAWVAPVSFWKNDKTPLKDKEQQSELPPPNSAFCLFSLSSAEERSSWPSVFIDDQLQVVLRISGDQPTLFDSNISVTTDAWNHVAVSYNGRSRKLTFLINGIVPDASLGYIIPDDAGPVFLEGLASQLNEYKFQGQIDEGRLWSHALHPETIKSKSSVRATGMEPLLQACWHFDEGTGTKVFDATRNGHDIDIVFQNPSQPPTETSLWRNSNVPMVSNIGLAKRTLRYPNIDITGGLGSCIYHEQITVSKEKNPSDSDKKDDTKPLKRGARVLLCFIAKEVDQTDNYLAVLDFGLLADGTLCDFPALIPLPSLSLSTNIRLSQSAQRASTPEIFVDAQGMELFGGLLQFEGARCSTVPPSVWDSANGSVTIYFQNHENIFSALTYDISRSVEQSIITDLAENTPVLVENKVRKAVSIEIRTSPCTWALNNDAIDVVLTASTVDGKKISETWRGMPTDLEKFCNLLNGLLTTSTQSIGTLNVLETPDEPIFNNGREIEAYRILLEEPLHIDVPVASFIVIGGRHIPVLQVAEAGDTEILVGKLYARTEPLAKTLSTGLTVEMLEYDHANLVSCQGKPASDFTKGSYILSIANSELTIGRPYTPDLVKSSTCSQFTTSSQCPFFSSPALSTALKLSENVYTMLEDTVETTACSGITFESWLKPESMSESVLVAYTSQKSPRSEHTNTEQQTFILGMREAAEGTGHDLICNTNGFTFSIKNPPTLRDNQWMHFACSSRNTFALKFNGSNYVDLPAASEFNVSDFSLSFTLKVDKLGEPQIFFSKSSQHGSNSPINIGLTSSGAIELSYDAENEQNSMITRHKVFSDTDLRAGVPYKIFISRRLEQVNKENDIPRSVQLVTILAWNTDGKLVVNVQPPSKVDLEKSVNKKGPAIDLDKDGAAQAARLAQANEAPLTLGGSPWATGNGLNGSIGLIRFYSSAIKVPASPIELSKQTDYDRSLIGAWSFREAEGVILKDDTGRNHGKFKGDPAWVLSEYEPDNQTTVYINGQRTPTTHIAQTTVLKQPSGPHQLTLGNVIHGDDDFRFLALPETFQGQFDELRIWNVPRTKENITDSMNSRLSEVSIDMAVYLPFDDPGAQGTSVLADIGFLADASINCWHLTPLHDSKPLKVSSEAPVSNDSPCVRQVLNGSSSNEIIENGVPVKSTPSIAEYGDMQVSATGGMDGSYKRAYSYIDFDGKWNLVTGFKIGDLITEWVSQIQTSPTLIGYIEGAPPIPAENYSFTDDRPYSAIRFVNAQRCSYTYSSRGETGVDLDVSVNQGIGAKWDVTAGFGVENQVSSGEIKGQVKKSINVSGAQINNSVSTTTTNTNLEMRVELTGASTRQQDGKKIYEAANTGLALVESEVADVFALRLKIRGSVAPLVAYQVRPNPDIPKDRNLVPFPMNRTYTKQGCLDGRFGLQHDEDYPPFSEAPKDASYYKPLEAYALKDRIRRQEEQLAGEYERTNMNSIGVQMPRRTHRNICNSYVWTADGGTFQETTSTMDVIQTEIGGSFNMRAAVGASLDLEVSGGGALVSCSVDALLSAHTTLTQTKELYSETGFELQTELPPAVDIRHRGSDGKLVKRPGAVDAYRWMSFWLEGSVEGTDAFFRQVVDPKWLDDAQEPSAKLLVELREALKRQSGNARTKAWRVLHRCTYVSRVPEKISAKPKKPAPTQWQEEKKATLLADIACNWHILQNLEPLVRGAKSRSDLAHLAQGPIADLYPTIRSQPRFNGQLLDLLGDYIGLP